MELSHADTGHNLFDAYIPWEKPNIIGYMCLFISLLQIYDKQAVEVTRNLETWVWINYYTQ